MTTAIGQFRHVVSLVTPGAGTSDPDGGWGGDAWVPLAPPTWHCSIQAASLRDLQRLSGGVLSTTATHVLRGRYHPQLTRTARIYFRDRVFDVESVHDLEERRIELEVIVHEQLGEQAPAPPLVPYADQVIADGASAYWRLDDAGGTIAIDRVGFAHGTISGGVTLNQQGALVANAAMAFDGTTGKIVTPSVAISAAFTVEAWIKLTTSGQKPVFSNRDAGGNLYIGTTLSGQLFIYNGLGGNGAIQCNDGQWHHAVYVISGTSVSFYVDGVLDRSQTVSAETVETLAVTLGEDQGVFWPGALDEVAFYPHALTAGQIAAHYAARTGTP